MAGRRRRRTEVPHDPARVIRALRLLRDLLVRDVDSVVVPFGPTHRLSSAAMQAIDALADHITGEKDYFMIGGSHATDAVLAYRVRQAARERGEVPWQE